MMLARLGLQELVVTNARLKRIPCCARRSMLGVRTALLPYGPQSSHAMSSAMRTKKLGRDSTAANAEPMTSVMQTHTHQSTREIIEAILGFILRFCRAVAAN